jgi:hypothetical protein
MNRTVATKELTLSCGHKIPLRYYGNDGTAFCERCACEVAFLLRAHRDGRITIAGGAAERVEVQRTLFSDSEGWTEYAVTIKMPQKGRSE